MFKTCGIKKKVIFTTRINQISELLCAKCGQNAGTAFAFRLSLYFTLLHFLPIKCCLFSKKITADRPQKEIDRDLQPALIRDFKVSAFNLKIKFPNFNEPVLPRTCVVSRKIINSYDVKAKNLSRLTS